MRFSILIPAYKSQYLSEAIDSVLAQSYNDFELVIVNDASPENLDMIIDQYNDSRIHYFKNQKNCGAVRVVDNWNICLSHANGEYVICMGDDDRLLSDCLLEYDKLIKRYPNLDVYHGWTQIINGHGEITFLQETRPELESVYGMIFGRMTGRMQYIGDFLFKTEALKNRGGFYYLPMAWGSDDITALIAANNKGIANTQIPVFQYRKNDLTISKTGNTNVKIQAVKLEEEWLKKFLDVKPSDDIDKIFHQCILDYMPTSFRLKTQDLLVDDIKSNGFSRFFYWMMKRKLTNLSIPVMLWIFVCCIKEKFKAK